MRENWVNFLNLLKKRRLESVFLASFFGKDGFLDPAPLRQRPVAALFELVSPHRADREEACQGRCAAGLPEG